jgi:hypothetical protein
MNSEKTEDDFTTVATFVLPDQMPVAKALIESRGIECRVLDEFTVQSYNFISNAVGGVKLQVRGTDFDFAKALLQEGGFITNEEDRPSKIDAILGDPIRLKQTKVALFGFLILSVLVTLAIVSYSIINAPTTYEKFRYGEWALDNVAFRDKVYLPKTVIPDDPGDSTFTLRVVDPWESEKIIFRSDGSVKIPGFYGPPFFGKWKFSGDVLTMYDVDTLGFLFEHDFIVQFEFEYMYLISDSSAILCYDER